MINIPFRPQFKAAMLEGVKIYTCRSIPYGNAGDRFAIFGAVFELVKVWEVRLQEVAEHYYLGEGCKSPAEFIEIWNDLHPARGYRPDDVRWLHQFKRVA